MHKFAPGPRLGEHGGRRRKCRRLIRRICILTTTILLMAPVSPVKASWEPVLGFDLTHRLGACETGDNIAHLTRSYVGAFGFAKPTWRMFADTSPTWAHKLTWAQQARVLDRAFWFGYGNRGPVGPWGHGCFKRLWKQDAQLRTRVCNNRKHQVRRWCRL
jgi:hypothetical protein